MGQAKPACVHYALPLGYAFRTCDMQQTPRLKERRFSLHFHISVLFSLLLLSSGPCWGFQLPANQQHHSQQR